MKKKLLLISSSTLHGSGYLDHCANEICTFIKERKEVLFIPYARPSGITLDEYTDIARQRFHRMGYKLTGIHEVNSPKEAVQSAETIFVGGGNTFVLLKGLYEAGIMEDIISKVNGGTPYIGTSAGSNVAGKTIGTTNDMPIVQPPSLTALGLVPFNINPHYLDPDPNSTHKGETREMRIKEFHAFNTIDVIALREGAMLDILGEQITLKGSTGARLFRQGKKPQEYQPGDSLDFLLSGKT
ncbi:MAG: dipeptidase PepE [Promethearchaeota archaeon]